MGENLCDLEFCDEFLDTTPKAKTMKKEMIRWTLLKLKTLFW